MRPGLVTVAALAVGAAAVLAGSSPAWADDPGGQNGYSSVQATAGALTVQADHTYWTPPSTSRWATAAKSAPPPGKPNPDQPYGCTYSAGGASATATLGVGGPQPGQWVFPVCSGPGAVDPMPPFWVSGATPPAAVVVQVSPVVVAQQAVKQLGSPRRRSRWPHQRAVPSWWGWQPGCGSTPRPGARSLRQRAPGR